MVKVFKNIFISWLILWSHMIMANSDLENQIKQMPQNEIDKLKDVEITGGVEEFIKDNKLVALSEEDKEVLGLLGFSDSEINEMGLENLMLADNSAKLQDGFVRYANNKKDEVEHGIMKDTLPGLASSVIGLGFASFLGVILPFRCRTQPSALTFSGSAAAWAGLELLNWDNYKIEMEKLKKLGNAQGEFTELAKLIKDIQKDVEILKPHAEKIKNLDTTAEGLEGIQTQLGSLRKKLEEIKALMIRLDTNQMDALRSLNKSLTNAAEVTKKKSRNAKIAAVGFTGASGLAVMEAYNVFGGSGACIQPASNFKNNLFRKSLEFIFPEAFALSISTGDLDKMGIPIGAGGAAAYLAFEGKFLDKIIASGWSRSLVFGIMAGNAYFASAKLKEAYEFLDKQARELKIFTDFFDKRLKQGINLIDTPIDLLGYAENEIIPKALELLEKFQEQKEKLEDADELLDQLNSIAENQDQLENIDQEQLNDIIQSETGQSVEEIQADIDKIKETDIADLGIDEFLSYKPVKEKSIIDLFIPAAYANISSDKIKPSCFILRPQYFKMDKSCSCKKSNSCTSAEFMELKPVKQVKGSSQTITFANEIMKANQMILLGAPKRGLARYQKLQKFAPAIERNTNAILKKEANAPSPTAGIRDLHKTITPALKGYFQKSGIPNYGKKDSQVKLASNSISPKGKSLLEKLKNKIALVKYLKGEKPAKNIKQTVTFKKSDFISPVKAEAIQKDSSLDIFQIIRQRYLKLINDGRL